ncbi:hypothetical protein ACFQ5J_11805 [Lacticaseibacillus baoqingensis]|uniref:Uncharacterized protein n=1 Tax=Lacticaseibacillus baoqingensis TaxID=2486013 RepID=A0ABW4E7T7_9LACO|nr:hypothetical protein [Lacticaseibacillus baoqingensis]
MEASEPPALNKAALADLIAHAEVGLAPAEILMRLGLPVTRSEMLVIESLLKYRSDVTMTYKMGPGYAYKVYYGPQASRDQ